MNEGKERPVRETTTAGRPSRKRRGGDEIPTPHPMTIPTLEPEIPFAGVVSPSEWDLIDMGDADSAGLSSSGFGVNSPDPVDRPRISVDPEEVLHCRDHHGPLRVPLPKRVRRSSKGRAEESHCSSVQPAP